MTAAAVASAFPSPISPSTPSTPSSISATVTARTSAVAAPTVAKSITFRNFWVKTKASFTPCSVPSRPPDFESQSGSRYWDNVDHVVRLSDHWTGMNGVDKIVDCRWRLQNECPSDVSTVSSKKNSRGESRTVQSVPFGFHCGMCRYKDFVDLGAPNNNRIRIVLPSSTKPTKKRRRQRQRQRQRQTD